MSVFLLSLVGLLVASLVLLMIGLRANDRWIVVVAGLALAAFMGSLLAFKGVV